MTELNEWIDNNQLKTYAILLVSLVISYLLTKTNSIFALLTVIYLVSRISYLYGKK